MSYLILGMIGFDAFVLDFAAYVRENLTLLHLL